MSLVSVIIVNWNGKHVLAECLDSLRAQTGRADEILVVDNGSSDGSQAMIRERYAEVTLVELGDNKGFSVANNIGIRRARGDYIALLNNDVLVHPDWLAHMVAAIEVDASLGSCACKMLFYDRRDVIDAAGDSFHTDGWGANRGRHQPDGEPFQRSEPVFGACAGAAIYRTSMFRDIGLFDEEFFMYFEDVDLAFRAQLAGYSCLYVPEAVVYHHYGASSKGSSKRYYYSARNALLVIVKNMPTPLLHRFYRRIVAAELRFALYMGMRGYAGEYARACLDTLRLLPRMLQKRHAIQAGARRSPEQVAVLLTDSDHSSAY